MANQPLLYLPPHLQEVSSILAIGLLRMRARRRGGGAVGATEPAPGGEISLHFPPDQSVYPGPSSGSSA